MIDHMFFLQQIYKFDRDKAQGNPGLCHGWTEGKQGQLESKRFSFIPANGWALTPSVLPLLAGSLSSS